LPVFDTRETASHTLPVESHFLSAPPDAAPAGQEPFVSVSSLAVHALLQEARWPRRPAVADRDRHAALQHDLHAVASTLQTTP